MARRRRGHTLTKGLREEEGKMEEGKEKERKEKKNKMRRSWKNRKHMSK